MQAQKPAAFFAIHSIHSLSGGASSNRTTVTSGIVSNLISYVAKS
jgi:hypothetical protein